MGDPEGTFYTVRPLCWRSPSELWANGPAETPQQAPTGPALASEAMETRNLSCAAGCVLGSSKDRRCSEGECVVTGEGSNLLTRGLPHNIQKGQTRHVNSPGHQARPSWRGRSEVKLGSQVCRSGSMRTPTQTQAWVQQGPSKCTYFWNYTNSQ